MTMERNRSDDKELLGEGGGPHASRAVRGAALPQPAVTAALRRAFFREWAARGYGALSLERVATRAGVGKAALYRRWPSKAAMATDLVEGLSTSLLAPLDTGSLRGDARAFLGSLARVLRHPMVRSILPDLHAEAARGSDLAPLLMRVAAARRARAAAILDRAAVRGELDPETDRALLLDLMAAPLYWRLVAIGGSASEDDLDRMADVVAATAGARP